MARADGAEIELRPTKASALLLYVASSPGWVSRSQLLFLFWPDAPERLARSRLRQLLYVLGKQPVAAPLEPEGQRIRWTGDTDVAAFRAAIAQDDPDAALDIYRGPLLDGFVLTDAPEFQGWLDLERDELHRAWRRASLTRAIQLREEGRPQDALHLMEPVLAADRLDEEALREVVHALAAAGRRPEALRTLSGFEDRLRAELGIGPTHETLALAEALRSGDAAASSNKLDPTTFAVRTVQDAGSAQRLPVPATPFVGRRAELETLRKALDHGVRLLSIVAQGGMGKTRLALELARSSDARSGVRAFASFVSVERPDQMETVLADALGMQLDADVSLRRQILGHLGDRDALLVLDNLEHLAEDLSLVSDILDTCPNTTIVTTSRRRLHLPHERIYDLEGLTVPQGREPPDTGEPHPDSVQLFLQAASRVTGALSHDDLDLDQVASLCGYLRGMPLAIELAAGWLRVLQLGEIRAEMESDLARGPYSESETGSRHRSMRAVFDATWSRLGQAERQAWAGLAVFEGTFDRDAATEVAGAELPLLGALINRGIVSRRSGRFDLHPLTKRYGRVKAAAIGLIRGARERHARHYLTWFERHAERFRGPSQVDAFQRAALEQPNLRAAWIAAIESSCVQELAGAALAMGEYYEALGLRNEFAKLADQAVAAFAGREVEKVPVGRDAARLVGRVARWSPKIAGDEITRTRRALAFAERAGDIRAEAHARLVLIDRIDGAATQELAQTALAQFSELGDAHGVARTERAFGWSLVLGGWYREGLASLQRAAARFRSMGDPRMEALAYQSMAPAYIMLGDFDRAEDLLRRAIAPTQAVGFGAALRSTLGSLQWLEMIRGDFAKAESYQDAFFAQIEEMGGDSSGTRDYLRAGLYFLSGDYAKSRPLAERRYQEHVAFGIRDIGTVVLAFMLARMALRSDHDLDAARRYFREGVDVGLELGTPRYVGASAAMTAELLFTEGRSELAASLAACALADEATEHEMRVAIDRLVDQGLNLPTPLPDCDRDTVRGILREVYGMDESPSS